MVKHRTRIPIRQLSHWNSRIEAALPGLVDDLAHGAKPMASGTSDRKAGSISGPCRRFRYLLRNRYVLQVEDHPDAPRLTLATDADIAELAALARAELPTMTALHDEAGWINYQRFGTGHQPRESWTVMLRASRPAKDLVGFAWVDDAIFVEAGVSEPWWCINALAVARSHRGQGFGTQLVEAVAAAGRSAEIALLFGQTVPDAVPFWQRSGFTLAEPLEPLVTSAPARRAAADPTHLRLPPGDPDRWFVRYLATEPGSVRSGLVPASFLK